MLDNTGVPVYISQRGRVRLVLCSSGTHILPTSLAEVLGTGMPSRGPTQNSTYSPFFSRHLRPSSRNKQLATSKMLLTLVLLVMLGNSGVQQCRAYELVREYSGPSFFDRWDFYGFWDNLTLGMSLKHFPLIITKYSSMHVYLQAT